MSQLSKQHLEYIVNHVFLPPKLPDGAASKDLALENDQFLCQLVLDAAMEFSGEDSELFSTPFSQNPLHWRVITRLLRKLVELQLTPSDAAIRDNLLTMDSEDSFVLHARAQNAAIIIRSVGEVMRFEMFEVSAPNNKVKNGGKLACLFPGPAIDIPLSMKEDSGFISELARFLSEMGSEAIEDARPNSREPTNPRYITQLLVGILRGIGHPADIQRVGKRIADEVHGENTYPWRRSPFWLVLRVALQTTLRGSSQSDQEYKSFMTYLLAKILQLAVDAKFPSDLIHVMHAKLSRRMTKLYTSTGPINRRLLKFLNTTGDSAHNFRTHQWEKIQRCQAVPGVSIPETLDFECDTILSLTHSRLHIDRILAGESGEIAPPQFDPNETPRYCGGGITAFKEAIEADKALALADFEEFVQTYLESWVTRQDQGSNACASLAEHFSVYSAAALDLYKHNVEDRSIMLLTLFELWMAIDRIATSQLPLLKDYHPEVSPALVEALLLRTFKSSQRGTCIMKYCRMRAEGAAHGSIFSDTVSENSFGVRYFQASPPLQRLESQIVEEAQLEREVAVQHFLSKKKEYEELVLKAERAEHEYNWRGNHDKSCEKCSWNSEASSLRVPIYEWPLPSEHLKAHNVIFELQAPSAFCAWRDITYRLLHDVCTPSDTWPDAVSACERLDTYDRLSSHNDWKLRKRRIGLASDSHACHGRSVHPKMSDICQPSNLEFRLYDPLHCHWAADLQPSSCDVSQHTTFHLPKNSPYCSLQFSVNRTIHTSNAVLANQSKCAQELGINEFIAFGTLRAGGRLQWLNIAREIAAKSLSMERWEVQVLIMQSAWQIGPVNTNSRHATPMIDWHEELENDRFCQCMLDVLDGLHRSVRANWMQMKAAHTATLIACRLLAFAKESEICKEIFALLYRLRKTAYDWMHDLGDKLRQCIDEESTSDLQARLCEAAASCRATYDVEDAHIDDAFRTSEDVSIFIECAITLCDNAPSMESLSARPDMKHLLDRDRRLSRSLETYLVDRISGDPSVLQSSLRTVWTSCPADVRFEQMETPNDRWFASLPKQSNELLVHLNILAGQLLVDSRPLKRLPKEITSHPMFLRIFGPVVLDVTPARNQSMPYATRDCFHGYRVTLGLVENGKAIAVEAEDASNGRVFNLIPHNVLQDDLPTMLVDSYAHWVERSTGDVELRPLKSPWDATEVHWHMRRGLDGSYRMDNPSCALLDINSPTVNMIFSHLAPIEALKHLIVTLSPDRRVSVELPRYRLRFTLQRNTLLSENHPGFIVDSVGTIGTFFGLQSRLVLAPSHNKLYARRRVIVPCGEIHIIPSEDHVEITINTDDIKTVSYHEYEVDEILGHLVDNGDLLGRFTKIYIHAITSFCLPDPLSGLTGTEMAIEELRSSSCLSFQKLRNPEFRMLCKIRAVAPRRKWYVQHAQTTKWHPHLSFLSQHDDFVHYSSIIRRDAERLHSGIQPQQQFDDTPDVSLQDRAVFRRRWCYAASLQRSPLLEDIPYGYERNYDTTRIGDVASLSKVILDPGNYVSPVGNLWDILKQWSVLGDAYEVNMKYSHKWCNPKWGDIWLPLCRKLRGVKTSSLLFTFSTAAYTSPQHRQLVHTLLALATDESTWGHNLPMRADASKVSVYDLSKGTKPDHAVLQAILKEAADFEESPFNDVTPVAGESGLRNNPRRQAAIAAFTAKLESQTKDAARQLVDQWPCEDPRNPRVSDDSSWLFDLDEAMHSVREHFLSWYRNHTLYQHIVDVQHALHTISRRSVRLPTLAYRDPPSKPQALHRGDRDCSAVSLLSLVEQSMPPNLPPAPSQISSQFVTSPIIPHTREDSELKRLFAPFQNSSDSMLRQKYGEQLEASRQAMARQLDSVLLEVPAESACAGHVTACENHFNETLSIVLNALQPNQRHKQTFAAGLWPRLTSRTILALLSHTTISRLCESWRDIIMQLAHSLLVFQRARRVHVLQVAGDELSLGQELQNLVPENECNPDWQLIQIEGDFLMRPAQRSVAEAMIKPQSGRSTLQQLQMGEGKSSVIVPLVAAYLSNGEALVRLIVPKALVSQMFRILARRLSGLAQRRIYYMPISRSMKIDGDQLRNLQTLWQECVQCRGVLIAQPDHILSFKLMVADHNIQLANARPIPPTSIARPLLDLERWLWRYSRDILDESDEILRVRYQVIYTAGFQEPMYDHPYRWLTTQCVLFRVRIHIPMITEQFLDDITVEKGNDGLFPRLRSIGASATGALVDALAEDALNGELTTCPRLSHLSPRLRNVAKYYMTTLDISPPLLDDVPSLCSYCGEDSFMWKTILLLRGLLAHGVLSYALGARCYRIDYGLAPERSILAVPYLAKDVPSLRAEFGHPDVCIILTCLSYHCGGLTVEQVTQCFEILLKLDDRKQEYHAWVRGNLNIPETLHDLDGVNLKDPEQRTSIIGCLFRYNRAVIDFFLSHVVFPKGAKEFPQKIATSSWDLAELKNHITTGFSGTNDNRFLLPASIEQQDQPNQLGTNAQVISFLLQPENNNYIVLPTKSDMWLPLIACDPDITILLDVGALMLNHSNRELAQQWLNCRPEAKAVVFFLDDDINVMSRDGTVEPFASSSYSERLDECLVYLDDAHTRGTDLKLPRDACAAVTLGSKVTKDRLVQGCMRMRRLGKGQSVKFFAPVDIDRKIKAACNQLGGVSPLLGAIDVLRWVILETCTDLAHSVPHWIAQGLDHQNRKCVWERFTRSEGNFLEELKRYWLQPEARSLEEMYGSSTREAPNRPVRSQHPDADFSMIERCNDLGFTPESVLHAHLDEEQEREVDIELEQERQVERPPTVKDAQPTLRKGVQDLVEHGRIPPDSTAFVCLFDTLKSVNEVTATSAAVESWTRKLIATKDFVDTVSNDLSAPVSNYIRPINWILSFNEHAPDGASGALILLSPFEANKLLPSIRESKFVHLHIYSPRVMQNCISFENLDFYTIPSPSSRMAPDPYITMQLNLMAGQLYVLDFTIYAKLLDFLGLVSRTSTPAEDMPADITEDGFVLPIHRRGRMRDVCPFNKSPIPFVKEMIGLRQKGMGYSKTHLGKILITSPLAREECI